MKNFEERDSRPDREDADGGQERRPAYTAFMKDKRNRAPQAEHTSHRSHERSGEGEERQERRFDKPYRSESASREGGFRRGGERRGGYRPRTEQEETTGQRRSFNPNFDASNRLVGQHKPFRRPAEGDGEEGERPRTYGSRPHADAPREGGRYREERPAGSWPKKGDQAGRGYRKSNRPYEKPEGQEEQAEGRPGRSFRSSYGDNKKRPYDGERKRSGNGKPFRRQEERRTSYDAEHYPTFAPEVTDGKIRLNRYIAMSGICSRREADEFIQAGVVTVNGAVVTELGAKVDLSDEVRFHGEVIRNERKVYIVMNKPKGYVTSVEDPHADKTVMDLLKNGCKERVYPVGRLDRNSLGLLLITNHGDMAKRLMHPSFEKKKVYQVSLDKPLTRADMDALVEGFELEDGEIHADSVSYVGEKKTEIGIEIHSGRNRIVRRMFEHLGYRVIKLDRVYFAGLTKQKLKRGEWRFLTPREVQALRSGQYE